MISLYERDSGQTGQRCLPGVGYVNERKVNVKGINLVMVLANKFKRTFLVSSEEQSITVVSICPLWKALMPPTSKIAFESQIHEAMKRNEITTTKKQNKNILKVNKTEFEVKMIGFIKLLTIMTLQNIKAIALYRFCFFIICELRWILGEDSWLLPTCLLHSLE